jgi:outer membrane immunogenic protein
VPFTWTGSYIGGYAGGATANGDGSVSNPVDVFGVGFNNNNPPLHTSFGLSASVITGVTSGYNYQFAPNGVIGYESETGYIHVSGSVLANPGPFGNADTYNHGKVGDWYSAYTLRLGYAWDRSMIYAKGGFAVARIEAGATDAINNPFGVDMTAAKWRVGYAAGAGWEYAFDPKWSLKAEYLYLGLENTYSSSAVTTSFPASPNFLLTTTNHLPGVHTAKIGLNYKWDWFACCADPARHFAIRKAPASGGLHRSGLPKRDVRPAGTKEAAN